MRPARGLTLLLAPAVLAAQTSRMSYVTIRVADTTSTALSGVDVSLVRDVSTVIAHATTDASGRVSLAVPRTTAPLQAVARRIGYEPAYQFFTPSTGSDSLTLELRLQPSARQLATVRVTAKEDLARKSYHLDAEDIASTTRTMLDGTDVFKLRPNMLNSRAGPEACGWIQSVWVNGCRVVLDDVDSQYVAGRKPAIGVPMALPPRPNLRLTPTPKTPTAGPLPWAQFSSIDSVLSILRLIKPEHIAEVNFQDCFGGAVKQNHSEMAMFIVLKPGIGFREDIGSYVIPPDTTQADGPALAVGSLARYRFRLLGAYDAVTGDPIVDVAVTDTGSGLSARTTATGTVSLFFLPEGTTDVRLHHPSYRDTTISVTISPRNTVPLTLLLAPRP